MAVLTSSIEHEAQQWSRRADISARSTLVTILGDSIAPLGGQVWLSDLIALAEPFGFSERLVRTSTFRLVSERWVENERVGRRSRYRLTAFANDEFAVADQRIYGSNSIEWNGEWTVVFGDGDLDPELLRHLRWHGFIEMVRGVWALPTCDVEGTHRVVAGLEIGDVPAIATARFADIAAVAHLDRFRAGSGLNRAEAAYQAFIDRYEPTLRIADSLDGRDSFILRTMLVHDLRRVRLNDPALPPELLPTDWVGSRALAIAAPIYVSITDQAWSWIKMTTGLSPTTTEHLHRFNEFLDPTRSQHFDPERTSP